MHRTQPGFNYGGVASRCLAREQGRDQRLVPLSPRGGTEDGWSGSWERREERGWGVTSSVGWIRDDQTPPDQRQRDEGGVEGCRCASRAGGQGTLSPRAQLHPVESNLFSSPHPCELDSNSPSEAAVAWQCTAGNSSGSSGGSSSGSKGSRGGAHGPRGLPRGSPGRSMVGCGQKGREVN